MVEKNKKEIKNSNVQLLEKPEQKPEEVKQKKEEKTTVKKETIVNEKAVVNNKQNSKTKKPQQKPVVVNQTKTIQVVEKKEIKPSVISERIETKPAVIPEKNENVLVKENKSEAKKVFFMFGILVAIFIALLILTFILFSVFSGNNQNIHNGVYIKGIDVSSLSKEDAKNRINTYIKENIPDEIVLKHGDFETAIPTSALKIKFEINDAVDTAYNLGRSGNLLTDGFEILSMMIFNKNVEPSVEIDEEALAKALSDVSSKLPDKLIESGYYIEGTDLILNKGTIGNAVNIEQMTKSIKDEISKLNIKNNKIVLLTNEVSPSKLNIEEIYSKVRKDPVNASYTLEPLVFVPSQDGIDFAISISEAKQKLETSETECVIPLKVLEPSITTNMINEAAFPDVLSDFSTYYYAGNYNRTTNLILAAEKINGTVLLPGEEFSYNGVVGARTIAAGYKEAPIYVSGQVVDGLGGGICQITTTLYNAVIKANLEVTDRSNHQFVPSYIEAGKDATVVYGAIDFKFVNNRTYPIKIVCSVEGGEANFKILGFRMPDDYDVEIESTITSQSSYYTNSATYKVLYKDGVEVDRVLLSEDSYKRH